MSLAMYFYLFSLFKPGDTIKIQDITGEIVSITPLHLEILGKNMSGDHTGELITIPNYQIRQQKIVLVDLSSSAIQKTILVIPFDRENYSHDFDIFVQHLRLFLDSNLPTPTAKTVGNYKSYKGHNYKLEFDIDDKGIALIRIGFVCKRSSVEQYKYLLINFIESLKIYEGGEIKSKGQETQKIKQ